MSLIPPALADKPADLADRDYAGQYTADLVSRWDELIDWNKRATGEGHFFTDVLLKAGVCRVFDVSTGSGFHASQLRKAGFDVSASDGSLTMIQRAKENLASFVPEVPLYHCDWNDLGDLKQHHGFEAFDAVLCLGSSLCHIFDRAERIEVLRRFRSLLKPGGMLLIDQRNFQAILAGHFTSSGQYYYCGKTASVTIGELRESLCEFVYTFADGVRHRLRVFPILPAQLRSELMAAGFNVERSYGDFKQVYDPLHTDFILHQASVPPLKGHFVKNSQLPIPREAEPLVAFDFHQFAPAETQPAPRVIWLTGLSAAGKSTIIDSLNPVLRARGLSTCILDGDAVRMGLCRDLSFSGLDREENVRRVAEVAALMADAGLTVLVALISPTRTARHHARSIIGNDRFVEVFVEAPLAVAEARDPKGLYRRARRGELRRFTGIDSPYEPPVCPEVHVRSDQLSVEEAVSLIDRWLRTSTLP